MKAKAMPTCTYRRSATMTWLIASAIAALSLLPALADTSAPTASSKPAGSADNASASANSSQDDSNRPLTQAEKWVQSRSMPGFILQDTGKKKHKAPVRSFVKKAAKGLANEVAASAEGMAKDAILVFSVQDIDPYDKKGPPANRPAIVLEMTMVDGTTAYLHRFPDNSFAVEGGFADCTVMVPGKQGEFIIKYPNHVQGRVEFQGSNTIIVHRPDNTTTTFSKTASGSYSVSNDKFGYMGTARPDSTGVQYEVDNW